MKSNTTFPLNFDYKIASFPNAAKDTISFLIMQINSNSENNFRVLGQNLHFFKIYIGISNHYIILEIFNELLFFAN